MELIDAKTEISKKIVIMSGFHKLGLKCNSYSVPVHQWNCMLYVLHTFMNILGHERMLIFNTYLNIL